MSTKFLKIFEFIFAYLDQAAINMIAESPWKWKSLSQQTQNICITFMYVGPKSIGSVTEE